LLKNTAGLIGPSRTRRVNNEKAREADKATNPAEDENELKPELLDTYCEAAASVAEELRDFLSQHYAELTTPAMTRGGHGYHGEMPLAADDQEYV
jgi:hypothetical protein